MIRSRPRRTLRAVLLCALCVAAVCGGAPRAETFSESVLEIRLQTGATVTFQVEIANHSRSRSRGLMHRRELAADRGMLLWWPSARRVNIWMENTYIPLDILFIDGQARIAKITAAATPLSRELIPSEQAVQAVLEINAGLTQQLGIREGDRVVLPLPMPDAQ